MAWNKEEPSGLEELKRSLWEKSDRHLAFRGQADCSWRLRTVFDRTVGPKTPRAEWLEKEQEMLLDFAGRARLFVSAPERFRIDRYRDRRAGPDVWEAMAIARHYGLATRALDWTSSVLAAAYFAVIDEPDKYGAVWWFDERELESVLDRGWDNWDVPKRDNDPRGERTIEIPAFQENYNHCWVTKVHFPVPFPRMEAQGAFLTICSRLGVDHCQAIDDLDVAEKGKIVIQSAHKEPLLAYLETIGISAHSLLYPGADVVALRINRLATSTGSAPE